MEVNFFEILLIDFTFYLEHVQKLVFNVLMKYEKKPNIFDGYKVSGDLTRTEFIFVFNNHARNKCIDMYVTLCTYYM